MKSKMIIISKNNDVKKVKIQIIHWDFNLRPPSYKTFALHEAQQTYTTTVF